MDQRREKIVRPRTQSLEATARSKDLVPVLKVLPVLLLVLLAACRSRDAASPVFDPGYLSTGAARDAAAFNVIFIEYPERAAGVIEDAWRETTPPESPPASLWRDNGLRVASAGPAAAEKIMQILKRARAIRETRRVVVIPFDRSFQLKIGPLVRSTGLAYTTSEATSYRDVDSLQFAVNLQVFNAAPGPRIHVNPLILTLADTDQPVKLKGLDAQFRFEEGGLLLLGPVEAPAQFRLGSFLRTDGEDGLRFTLVLVEMRLS